jgi:iron(III) transport system ATP-binding protein
VVLPGVVHSGSVRCSLGVLSVDGPAHEGAVEVMIRPEQVNVVSPQGNSMPLAVVTRRRFLGPEVTVSLCLRETTPDAPCEVTARIRSQTAPSKGDLVGLVVSGSVRVYPGNDATH